MKIYKVGGCVRDTLLGTTVRDTDYVVVGSTPEDLIKKGFSQVGAEFPVFLHPTTREEYALARTEVKTGKGYQGFNCQFGPEVTLEDDLKRRDLTINAMAFDREGNLVDLFGGEEDLKKGVLRHVSDAFAEDPLRVLRVARFAARFEFKVAKETNAMMKSLVRQGELNALTPERVWVEVEKALAAKKPSIFFEVLKDCGALSVLFPELAALEGVPQPKVYHPEGDCWIHTMLVLDWAAGMTNDKTIRFAALLHDLGKGATDPKILPHHYGHESRSAKLAAKLCERFRVPNEYKDLAVLVGKWHTHCHTIQKMKPATVLKTLERMDAYRRPDRIKKFVMVCEADSKGRGEKLSKVPYTAGTSFLQRLEKSRYVDALSIISKMKGVVKGNRVGEAVRRERLRLLQEK